MKLDLTKVSDEELCRLRQFGKTLEMRRAAEKELRDRPSESRERAAAIVATLRRTVDAEAEDMSRGDLQILEQGLAEMLKHVRSSLRRKLR